MKTDPAAPSGNPRRLLAGAALLVLAGAAVWGSILVIELLVRPGSYLPPAAIDLVFTDNWRDLQTAQRKTVELHPEPAYQFRHERETLPRALFVYDFSVDQQTLPSALLLGWQRGIYEVRLNGELLKAETPADTWGLSGGFEPEILTLPQQELRIGSNQLTFLVGGASMKILPTFSLGSLVEVFAAYRWGRLFSVNMVLAATGAMLFLAVAFSLVRWPAADRVGIVALVVLLLLWSLKNLQGLNADSLLPKELSRPLHFLVTYWFLASFAVAVWAHTNARLLWLRTLLGVTVIASLAFLLSYWLLPWGDSWRLGFDIESALTGCIVLFSALRLAWTVVGMRVSSVVISALLLAGLVIVAVDHLDDRYALHVPLRPDLPLTLYVAPAAAVLIVGVMLVLLVRRMVAVREELQRLNDGLSATLKEREAELQAEYEHRALVAQEHTRQEERRRILRNMHDGLGSRLSSLALEAMDPKVSRDHLASELGLGLADLRLLVDSLDTEGDSLALALGSFRGRVEPALRRAGIKLIWDVDENVVGPGFGASEVLEIYRLLQEALRNVTQHSTASEVRVSLQEEAGQLIVEVHDNGTGFGVADTEAQGIRGMRERAASLGGSLTLRNTNPGFLLRVRVACKAQR